jgi:hypothetical protein
MKQQSCKIFVEMKLTNENQGAEHRNIRFGKTGFWVLGAGFASRSFYWYPEVLGRR